MFLIQPRKHDCAYDALTQLQLKVGNLERIRFKDPVSAAVRMAVH